DHSVKVWDAQTGERLLSVDGHSGGVQSVAFSPDGKYLASSSVGIGPGSIQGEAQVKVWDAQTGRELSGHTGKGFHGAVTRVIFSPDGKRLASASHEKTVDVWDAQTGRETVTLKGHSGYIRSIVFSPDGKRLASASDDNTVKVWDAQTGQELLT